LWPAPRGLDIWRRAKNPRLEETVKELAEKAGLSMPKLAIMPDETLNAFVFGRKAKKATLAVHEGLLKNSTGTRLRAL